MKNRGLSYGNPFLYDTSNKLNVQIAMYTVRIMKTAMINFIKFTMTTSKRIVLSVT